MNRYDLDRAFFYTLFTPVLGVTQVNFAYNNVECAKKIVRKDKEISLPEIYKALKLFCMTKEGNK